MKQKTKTPRRWRLFVSGSGAWLSYGPLTAERRAKTKAAGAEYVTVVEVLPPQRKRSAK